MPQKNTTRCDKCGVILHIERKPWPFCPHESTLPVNARRFAPTVIYVHPTDKTKIYNPGIDGHPLRKAPKGYRRLELDTQAKMDRFERERGVALNARNEMMVEGQRAQFSARNKELLSHLNSLKSSVPPEARHEVDKLKERIERSEFRTHRAESYIEVNHYDQSNRERHRDESGRSRKE